MKQRSYWKTLEEDIFSQKILLALVLLTTVACFGFTVTNASIGIDDPAREYYLFSNKIGNMIQQGRIFHVIFNLFTGTVDFIPYFNDFVGAGLYALSALLYCGLLQTVTRGKFSQSALACFACVYISSSVIAEKYIYNLDVVVTMLSYCAAPLALLYAWRFVREGKAALLAGAVAVLMVSLASYETFIFLYICGVFSIFALEIALNQRKMTFGEIFLEGLRYAAILAAAMAAYYALVWLLQMMYPSEVVYIRYNVWKESGLSFLGTFWMMTKEFARYFADSFRNGYVPVVVFSLASLAGLGLFAALSWRRKNLWLLVCYLAMWVCNFVIHYVGGSFMPRAAQTFCFFVAFVLVMLVQGSEKKLHSFLLAGVCLLVFIQSADMNRWFYNDYMRYKKEAFLIDSLALKVASEYDVSKPLVFTNAGIEGYLNTDLYPGGHVNGNSMIYWMGYAFGDKTQPFIAEVFRMHGYDYIVSPTPEQYDQACIAAETMPVWPKQGSVQEFADFIVVNFG